MTINLVVVVMFYNKSVQEIYQTMFTVCSIMVTNTMACLVFRNTKLGIHEHITTTSEMSPDRSRSLPMFRRPVNSTLVLGTGVSDTDDATTDPATESKKEGI